jgi:2-polyprenyl-3-methyl-5-hydroxy-6-metoxy-1,4-benzoquinol methylase
MKTREKCLCCNKKELSQIINLGKHSFADRFISKKNLKKRDPLYPLIVDICKKCSFIQLKYITNPKDRYVEVDYSYTSSNSSYSRNHWDQFLKDVEKIISKKNFKKVLEIGANDGYLSQNFAKKNYKVVAVDASKYMINLIKKRSNLNTENLIFDFTNSKILKKKYNLQDIIIANNVFNHSDNPSNFLKGVKSILNKKGIFIFEQPYFTKSIKEKKFDQIYHEHVSYFTIKNIQNLLEKNGFKVLKINLNNYHGGSIRTFAILKENNLKSLDTKKMIKKENKSGVNNILFYKKFNDHIKTRKKIVLRKIKKLRSENFQIFGIGAAAKANTLLTYYNLDNKKIKFITDGSKFKINKFTPKTRIKILKDERLKKFDKIACIILAWNISKLLKNKLKKINKKIKFISI